ncbi:hypothetical protein ACCT25_30610, partial [Rhizobium ruizarguesonis]
NIKVYAKFSTGACIASLAVAWKVRSGRTVIVVLPWRVKQPVRQSGHDLRLDARRKRRDALLFARYFHPTLKNLTDSGELQSRFAPEECKREFPRTLVNQVTLVPEAFTQC